MPTIKSSKRPDTTMLKWCGNKQNARVTSTILELFQRHRAEVNDEAIYISPFCGALGDILAIRPDRSLCGDINPYLIGLYEEVKTVDRYPYSSVIDEDFVWTHAVTPDNFNHVRARFNSSKMLVESYMRDDSVSFSLVKSLKDLDIRFCDHVDADIQTIIRSGSDVWERDLESIFTTVFISGVEKQILYDLLWLNQTCFNGLYRENQAGIFNSPIGKKGNGDFYTPSLGIDPSFLNIVLNSDFYIGGYASLETAFTENYSSPFTGNFIYADPVYHGAGANYGCPDTDYDHLARMLSKWHKMGNTVCITNADVPIMRELYENHGFSVESTTYNQSVGCSAKSRKKAKELIAYKLAF